MNQRLAVVLAGGKGTRMKSKLSKVLHPVCGLPMVEHVLRVVKASGVNRVVTIIGHGSEDVKAALGDATEFALQEEQLGTGHAVLQAASLLENAEGNTLVICGDTPLVTQDTISKLFEHHERSGAQATVLSAKAPNPTGYGRIIRDTHGEVLRIVEQKDGTPEELQVDEISTGTYVFNNRALFDALKLVTNDNAQGEYYLPDVMSILKEKGDTIAAFIMSNMDEGMGVNDRVALAQATRIMQQRINEKHMREGVTFTHPDSVYIEADVIIGSDTVIEAGVQLKGNTIIGQECFIGAQSEIVESKIDDAVTVTHSVIEHSTVQSGTDIGPFAHLRPNSHLGRDVHIGNFVEVKNSTIKDGTKSGHLTYIGDADLGKNINIGCGTIFVNYDGKRKHRSTVGDDVFIGCNANIVSPVNIEDRVFIAAGATITHDIEAEALAISRTEQRNIPNYWQKFIKK